MTMFQRISLFGILTVSFFLKTTPGEAATIEIAYTSLEKMIVERVMTEGGRHYLDGDPSSTCLYSFIQEPRVDGVDGRLRITVLYAGRAGKEIAGKCVGPGDNFDLEISGIPTYERGEFFLDDLKIDAPDTAYFKIVAPFVEKTLREDIRYPLKDRLDYAAGWISSQTSSGRLALDSLQVSELSVGREALTIGFDFDVSIEP
jgi:hypothetical protein